MFENNDNLKDIILSEVKSVKKDKHWMILMFETINKSDSEHLRVEWWIPQAEG